MLKRMSVRKITLATFTLLILLTLYFIPNPNKEINLDSSVEYVYSNNLDVIYLLDSNDYVARTKINSCDCEPQDKAKDLIQGLIIGGEKNNVIPNGFRSIIPSGTTIKNIELIDKNLTIDFSKDLLDIDKAYEEKMIEAITYTLTSIKGIDSVTIKVEGEVLNKLPISKKTLPTVLTKDYGINKEYELTTLKDIDSFTVYYVNSYNDNNYYVPVTKYVNNKNQDKIKVIINELSSAPIYETNLMSFLNVSAKLLDYEIVDNKIKLNFNNMILSDITSNKILEEVVYTICLSLENEYNVEEVTFLVENEKIVR
jgi:germination protein M